MPSYLSKSDIAYAELKARILSDQLGPGAVIGQERIAAEMGLSTTPVREALKRLTTEGLVQLEVHRDARVASLSAHEARSLYELRQAVDPLAAELAAHRRTTDDIAAITSSLRALRPLSSPDVTALRAHREFHRSIYRASANPILIGVLEGLWDQADRYRIAALGLGGDSRADRARVRAEHSALAKAVIAGDAEAARSIMHEHVARSLGRVMIDELDQGSP